MSDDTHELSRLNNELATAHRELAKTNAELARLNEQNNQFFGMAAHDLRNPLGAIITYSELLLEEAAPRLTAEHVEFISLIKSLGEFVLRLVNDLVDVSKLEAGKLELQLEDVDLVGLVKRNVMLNGILAHKKGIMLTLDAGEGALVVSADPGRIEQALTKLVTNAIKFSPPETTVEVRISRHDGEALLTVRDEGPGIPASELEMLFRPFQRTSVKSTGGERGTGLGLVIARKIVEGHGGRIWVESEVGNGSAFYVALPIAAPRGDQGYARCS
jgi:two-component system sensor histidine kinase/response regulator